MTATEAILRYAQEAGLRFMTYRAYYEARKDERPAAQHQAPDAVAV